jgi:hypothetical protein
LREREREREREMKGSAQPRTCYYLSDAVISDIKILSYNLVDTTACDTSSKFSGNKEYIWFQIDNFPKRGVPYACL